MAQQQLAKFVWMNGQMVPWQNATVHVFTHALHYGTGVFEGIRAYEAGDDLLIFRLKDHMRRLHDSGKVYGFNIPYSEDDLCRAVIDLIRANDFHTALYIRPIAFKSVGGIGFDVRSVPTHVSILAFPFKKYFNPNKVGLDVCVSTWRRLGDPSVPATAKATGHYLNSYLAKNEALQAGFDEAIFLDTHGNVSEGTGENIFIVRNGAVATPHFGSNILKGITRETVIDLMRDNNIPYVERDILRGELYICDEAFFTGTAAEVTPILSIDHKPIGKGKPGPISQLLQKEYGKLVTGENRKYAHFITSVYKTVKPRILDGPTR